MWYEKSEIEDVIDIRIHNFLEKPEHEEGLNEFFQIALIYELARIADVLEDKIHISGSVNTYEQNFGE